MYIISVITTSPLYFGTHLFTHSLPPSPYRQSMLVGNDKSMFAVEGVGGDCQLATFSYFYLVIVFPPANMINLVHTCLRTHNAKRGGRQFSMFMSGNICALVDLFDKAVAEGARQNTVKTRSEPYDDR